MVVAVYVVVVLAAFTAEHFLRQAGISGLQLGEEATLAIFLLGTMSIASGLIYLLRGRAKPGEVARANAALRRPRTWLLSALVLAALWTLSYAIDGLASWRETELVPGNVEALDELLVQYPLAAILFIVLVAPVTEEVVFRRVLFGRFMAAGCPMLGYVLTGALFAFAHEGPGLSVGGWLESAMLWLNYFAFGALLAWLYQRTGSLWAPILVHAANNALAVVVWQYA